MQGLEFEARGEELRSQDSQVCVMSVDFYTSGFRVHR